MLANLSACRDEGLSKIDAGAVRTADASGVDANLPGSPDAEQVVQPSAELGTGTDGFQPIQDGSDQVLYTGVQGGHHFIVHSRMRGLLPGDATMPGLETNPVTLFTVWSESGERLDVGAPPYVLGYWLVEGSDGLYELSSARIVQVEEARVEEIYAAAHVRMRLDITDSESAMAWDERWVKAVAN